ncbi:uncharacterized protein LOC121511275 [Cheilinus undulatus]|uniref:uncharacterized protein LOC121511275 n=1 Tax=Cheilinus undulatus TaxID=241271 RepID=UPI001BD52582|nr:uncharacterized protein LOC121511275 [Cheilinus undulatus]
MTAFEGGSATVLCHYKYVDMKGWCQLGSTCVTEHTGTIGGATVIINDTIPGIYNVTMSGLTTANSGWYLCNSEAFQMPVHLRVHELTSTTAGTTITINTNFTGTLPATTQPSFIQTNASLTTNSNGYPASGGSLQDKHKISTEVMILIIALVSLLLFITAALIGWRMIKHRKTKPVVGDICMSPRPENDPALLYATISHDKHGAAQEKNHEPEESVMYSTIIMKDHLQVCDKVEPSDGSVIYSTVKPTEK